MRGLRGALLAVVLAFGLATAPAGAVSVSVTGPPQTVYDWGTMRCFAQDAPDIPTRAFRDAAGQTQLTLAPIGGLPATRMIGPNLDNLTHDCTQVFTSSFNPLFSDYDDSEWLGSTYTPDGQDVFALIHSEYHGTEHPGYCSDIFGNCRPNTVTFARSTNGGALYTQAAPPQQLVAALPYRYVPGDGRYGYFAPSNIIEKDGFYYSFIDADEYKLQHDGACLMRTRTLSDPDSWRAWDGNGFDVRFVDPYRESVEPLASHVCTIVSPKQLGAISRSVVWSTYLNKYVMVGKAVTWVDSVGGVAPAFYYSLSDDLIHWTKREVLMIVEDGTTWQCGDPEILNYPAFLDPDSTDRNYNTMDQSAYVYAVASRHENCIGVNSKRDIVRIPIQWSQ
jgi:hypothetical protein